MHETELERRFLVRVVPNDFLDPTEELVSDLYLPRECEHAQLRVRQKGDKYEITKKVPAAGADLSQMREYSIPLTLAEFQALKTLPGKALSKQRTRTVLQGAVAEFGEFRGELEGLIMLDVEFSDTEQMSRFKAPEYVVAEVTNDQRFAGGELCGKSIDTLLPALREYGYDPKSIALSLQ